MTTLAKCVRSVLHTIRTLRSLRTLGTCRTLQTIRTLQTVCSSLAQRATVAGQLLPLRAALCSLPFALCFLLSAINNHAASIIIIIIITTIMAPQQ